MGFKGYILHGHVILMEHFLHFLKIKKLRHFSESPQIHGNWTGNQSYMKSQPEMHVGNSDSVGYKLACNVHVWAYCEKIPVSGKTFLTKNGLWSWAGHFLCQISCSQ